MKDVGFLAWLGPCSWARCHSARYSCKQQHSEIIAHRQGYLLELPKWPLVACVQQQAAGSDGVPPGTSQRCSCLLPLVVHLTLWSVLHEPPLRPPKMGKEALPM